MENTQNNSTMHAHGDTCGCGSQKWMGGRYSGMRFLRYFLMFVILMFVFSFGMQMGELKGMLRASGYGMHESYGRGDNMMYQGNGVMMHQVQLEAPATAPAAPAVKAQ